ncbi:MAG: hypothetical protein BJ554DRAFT_3442, partial [Olpidium bornovanus]
FIIVNFNLDERESVVPNNEVSVHGTNSISFTLFADESEPELWFVVRQPSFHVSAAPRGALSVKSVGVIGAGQMGIGIAFVAAAVAKLPVTVLDKNDEQMRKGLDFLESILAKDVKKGKITEGDKKDALGRIRTTNVIEDFRDADCVIEIPALKREIFSSLSRIAKPSAILASNTSSISITKIAAATGRPENVIGMHFMNPGGDPVRYLAARAPGLVFARLFPKLVEVIPGLATSDETERITVALAEAMGKTVSRSADVPGFIANRLLMPFINEAVVALQE